MSQGIVLKKISQNLFTVLDRNEGKIILRFLTKAEPFLGSIIEFDIKNQSMGKEIYVANDFEILNHFPKINYEKINHMHQILAISNELFPLHLPDENAYKCLEVSMRLFEREIPSQELLALKAASLARLVFDLGFVGFLFENNLLDLVEVFHSFCTMYLVSYRPEDNAGLSVPEKNTLIQAEKIFSNLKNLL